MRVPNFLEISVSILLYFKPKHYKPATYELSHLDGYSEYLQCTVWLRIENYGIYDLIIFFLDFYSWWL